jgi:hypothetical protein
MIANFSRLLIDDLKQQMSDAEFKPRRLRQSTKIYRAAAVKV